MSGKGEANLCLEVSTHGARYLCRLNTATPKHGSLACCWPCFLKFLALSESLQPMLIMQRPQAHQSGDAWPLGEQRWLFPTLPSHSWKSWGYVAMTESESLRTEAPNSPRMGEGRHIFCFFQEPMGRSGSANVSAQNRIISYPES